MPSELIKQLSKKHIHVFLEAYGVTNDQGEKLDFKEHAYMWDIYQDFSPRQVIMKAAQVTMSTCANHKALWIAKNKGLDIIYSLPAASDTKEFVSGKTNRLIMNNPVYQEWTKDKDSIEQKKVGENIIYYRGTWTERAAIAIPADLYICDEMDRSKQDIVTQYKTRLQHSKYGWEWYFSNPSTPGVGVDKIWQDSDQKHWFITCPNCEHEWYLTMENIMEKDGKPYFGCTKCQTELDRHHGKWIAKYPDRKISGYWISLLMAPRFNAQYILDKKKEMSDDQFANYVLGIPYATRGSAISKPMFLQNLVDETNPQDSIPIIGVDTGIGINYVIGNKYGLFYYDKCSDYKPLEDLMDRYSNAIMIIDQGGDIIGPRKLREKYPNRVYLCFFSQDRKNDEMIRWKDDDGTVTADRNKCIQLVIDEFHEKRIPIYGSEGDWWNYIVEWLGMNRTMEENSLGVNVFKWNKPSTGRCDYPFATVYWRIGMNRFMEIGVTFNGASDSFGSLGVESLPNHTAFLPKRLV